MTGFNSKRDAAADKQKEYDPCPQCIKGAVCRTPKCGRLALPLDHPFRNAQPAQEQWNAALDEAAARINEIKGFGKATQDSFAIYIRGLKR